MNGNFYQNPTFPANNYANPKEDLFIQNERNEENINNISNENTFYNILKNNKGKKVKISIPKINDKTYEGILEDATDNYVIIRDNLNNTWYLINNNKLNIIEFLEEIKY